jgi:hypothetical protein
MSITAAGRVDRAEVVIDGSGNLAGRELTASEATIDVPGSGEVVLTVEDRLEVTISGSGDVTYYGDPQLSRDVSGSGSVDQAGEE